MSALPCAVRWCSKAAGVHATRVGGAIHVPLAVVTDSTPVAGQLQGMARTIEDLVPEEALASVLLADPDVRHRAEQARLATERPGSRPPEA